MRDMLFVSHANPEDDEFSRWLALQLASAGYPVWCDLTKLLGGENFWREAEQAIRTRTLKFLYVLTRVSNEKPGPLDELQVARNVMRDEDLHDFIIPLGLDDLHPRAVNIRLTNLNVVGFQDGWAAGLGKLLKKLEDEHVPRDPRFSASAVSSWWSRYYRRQHSLRKEPETLISNWFPFKGSPVLQFHELQTEGSVRGDADIQIPPTLPHPAIQHQQYLVTFADAGDFANQLGHGVSIKRTKRMQLARSAENDRREWWTFEQEHNALVHLLRLTWLGLLGERQLPTYIYSDGAESLYFRSGMIASDRVYLPGTKDRRQPYRQVVGFATTRRATADQPARLRHWHFALEARPIISPQLGLAMKPHVVFSDDGVTLWTNKQQMHRARRSQCRYWWNDEWRDRILGAVAWLGEGASTIRLRVGSDKHLELLTQPLQFRSPISYDDSAVEVAPLDELDDEDLEDEEEQGVQSGNT